MKTVLSSFLILVLLSSTIIGPLSINSNYFLAAFAEDFSSLTDDELISLFQDQVTTLDQMGLVLDEASIIDVSKQKLTNLKNKILTDVGNPNTQSSLIQKIDSALNKLDDATQFVETLDEQQANNMMNTAGNIVDAFINSVQAQKGKKIPTELADELINDASEISLNLEKRDNDIIPVIQDFDLPLAKSLIDKSEIELETLRNIFAELENRDVEIEIVSERNSPPFPKIKIKGIDTVINAATESWATTNAVNTALIELDQQPLNDYEFVGLFLINASAFASLDLVLGDIPEEDEFVLELADLVVGAINESDFVFDVYLPALNEILASLLIPVEVEAIIALRDHFLPILIVITDVINDNDGINIPGDFIVRVIGTNPIPSVFTGIDGNGVEVRIAAGEYQVEQDPVEGYDVTFSNNCSSDVNGPIKPAEKRTCVITNDDIPTDPTLIVIKKVINDESGILSPGDFTIQVTGNDPSPSEFTGVDGTPGTPGTGGVEVTLQPGAYSVIEVPPITYTVRYEGECSGTIASGETKTCVVINEDRAEINPIVFEDNFNDGILDGWIGGGSCSGGTCIAEVSNGRAVIGVRDSSPSTNCNNQGSNTVHQNFNVVIPGDYYLKADLTLASNHWTVNSISFPGFSFSERGIFVGSGADTSRIIDEIVHLNPGTYPISISASFSNICAGTLVTVVDNISVTLVE